MKVKSEFFCLLAAAMLMYLAVGNLCHAEDDGWEWTKSAGWSRSEGTAKGTPEEQFQYAKELHEQGNYYDAARQYFLLVRTFPNSREASRAIMSLAECLFGMENYYASFKALEQSIEKYPKSIHLPALLELEFRIGKRFVAGAPPSLFNSKDPKRDSLLMAIEVFKAIIKHDEFGPLADDCYSELGMAYLELNHPQKAKDNLSILLSSFPESPLVPLARYRIALANVQLGQGTLAEAKKRLEELKLEVEQAKDKGETPVSGEVLQKDMASLQEEDAVRMYEAAVFYMKRGSPKSYDAAMFSLQEILRRYPESKTAATAKEAIEKLRKKGKPKKGIDERNFNLPNLPIPSVSKIPVANKLAFWAKNEEADEEDNPEKKAGAEAAPPKMGYSGVSVKPVSKLYQVGKVTVDFEAEESRLESAAKPAQKAVPLERTTIEEQSAMIKESAADIVAQEDSIVSGKPIGANINEDDVLLEIPASRSEPRNINREMQKNVSGGVEPIAKSEPQPAKDNLQETQKRLEEYEKEAQEELLRMSQAADAQENPGELVNEKEPVVDEEVDGEVIEKTLNAPDETVQAPADEMAEDLNAFEHKREEPAAEEKSIDEIKNNPVAVPVAKEPVKEEEAGAVEKSKTSSSGWTLSTEFDEAEDKE